MAVYAAYLLASIKNTESHCAESGDGRWGKSCKTNQATASPTDVINDSNPDLTDWEDDKFS